MILKSKQMDAGISASCFMFPVSLYRDQRSAAARGSTAAKARDEVLVGSFEDKRRATVTNIIVRVVKRESVLVL